MSDPSLSDLDDYQAKDSQQALDAALAAVRTHCGWDIAPTATETVDLWAADDKTLFVDTLNLTAVTSVTQDGVVLDPDNYTFESYGVIKRTPLGGCFNRLTQVTVEFEHGYAAMPADVKAVILGFAQRSISDTRGLVASQSATGATAASLVQAYGPVLTDADKSKLAPYTLGGPA